MPEHPKSECRSWLSIADLIGAYPDAPIALIGAGMAEKSLTPGRCDLGPSTVRNVLKRFSTYDVEKRMQLDDLRIHDAGDINLKTITPGDGYELIRDVVVGEVGKRDLTLLIGGNNAITRPGVHGLGGDLTRIGLITLDAHFDLRDTDCGLLNGNPVRALLEDGLPGQNIAQIGLAPFANTGHMHEVADEAGIDVKTLTEVKARGIEAIIEDVLERLEPKCDAIFVDFDIDVIDRAQCPGAPGARPGGMSVDDFFFAARQLAARPKVKAADLTEFDPGIDVADITALTAGRWVCEILAGYALRG